MNMLCKLFNGRQVEKAIIDGENFRDSGVVCGRMLAEETRLPLHDPQCKPLSHVAPWAPLGLTLAQP